MNYKGLFAKILASENIVVKFDSKHTTASFNTITRVLRLPIYREGFTDALYNTQIGHEVGHALETPENCQEILAKNNIPFSLGNIGEDVRIEKIMKRNYPGLRQFFYHGRKEMLSRNFYGIKDSDPNKLNLLDRINLHAKCGDLLNIKFSDKEQPYVDMVFEAETFDDVVNACKELLHFLSQPTIKLPDCSCEAGEDDDTDNDGSDDTMGNENDEDSEIDGTNSSDQNNEEEEKEEENVVPDVNSETETAFKKNESLQLVDPKITDPINVYYPEMMDASSLIIPYQEILAKMDITHFPNDWMDLYHDYVKDNAENIRFLTAEFNRKKNAVESKKIQYNRSGIVNMNKLAEYTFNSDIFLRNTNTFKAKSHGLVLFMDWSGSMLGNLKHSLVQLFSLCDFCRKSKIPFDVYAFSDNLFGSTSTNMNYSYPEFIPSTGNMKFRDKVKFLHFLSSRMTEKEYIHSQSYLFYMTLQTGQTHQDLKLNGTPFDEAIFFASDIVNKFRNRTNVQIVNTVFVSDGQGIEPILDNNIHIAKNSKIKIFVHDLMTKNIMEINSSKEITNAGLSFLKDRTGTNVIGFYLHEGEMVSSSKKEAFAVSFLAMFPFLAKMYMTPRKVARHWQEYMNGATTFENVGYDEFYVLNARKMNINTKGIMELLDTEEKKLEFIQNYGKDFNIFLEGKIRNKHILSNFISLIS